MWGIESHSEREFEIWGDIGPENVDDFCCHLQRLPQNSRLDLWDLCIDDGPSLAVIVSALRLLAPCTLIGAPKMLAHTIYKINGCSVILLESTRSF